MTSVGHTITQPAHPVQRPLSMTSSYSSFHCAVQRSRAGAGASSVIAIARPDSIDSPGGPPHVTGQVALQIGMNDAFREPPRTLHTLERVVVAARDDRLQHAVV